jgi:hypothetical protein
MNRRQYIQGMSTQFNDSEERIYNQFYQFKQYDYENTEAKCREVQ